jgi:hypothetical protein
MTLLQTWELQSVKPKKLASREQATLLEYRCECIIPLTMFLLVVEQQHDFTVGVSRQSCVHVHSQRKTKQDISTEKQTPREIVAYTKFSRFFLVALCLAPFRFMELKKLIR